MIDYRETGVSSERTSEDYLTMNSCGIEQLRFYDRGSMRRKGRVDYHILYIERGICRLVLDEKTVSVGAGGLILFRPHEPQIYSFLAKDESVSHYIHFTGNGCEELLNKLGIGSIRVFDMGISHSYEEISAKMTREYQMKKPYWESFCNAYLHELLNLIARKYALRSSNVNHLGESRINAACRRICDNLQSPPDVGTLAAECCLSESRFTHLFREVTGSTLTEFVRSLRIGRAKELLATDMSIREIAESVGIADQNYFSRIFKHDTGLSPIQYRSNTE